MPAVISLQPSIFHFYKPGVVCDALHIPATSFPPPCSQPGRTAGAVAEEEGSTCGINPWICSPALAFPHSSSQHCTSIHLSFLQYPQPTWRQTEPPQIPRRAAGSRGQLWLPSIPPPWHLQGVFMENPPNRPWHLTRLRVCSIPEATAHSAGTCTAAPTPNPTLSPSPQVAPPQAPANQCTPVDGGTGLQQSLCPLPCLGSRTKQRPHLQTLVGN